MAKDTDKIIADQTKEIADLKKQLAKKREQEAAELGEIIDYTADILANEEKILESVTRRLSAEETLQKAIQRQSGKLAGQAKVALDLVKQEEERLKTEKKRLTELQKQSDITKELLKIQGKYGDEIEKSLGFLDDISDTIKEIPVVGGILSKALGVDDLKDRVSKELQNTLASTLQGAKSNAGSLKDMLIGGFKGATASAKGLMAALGPMLPIAIAIGAAVLAIKKGFEFDQEITDLAKGLGIAKDEARGIHSELKDIASTTEVIGADTAELSKAYIELAKGLGSAKLATAELAETQILLTKQYGLAGDEATEFQKIAMVSGKTAEQNVVAIQAITNQMTGGMMNYRDVMKDVAGTSKAVQATFKGNIGQLTKAVITAKKFGKTLDEVKEITNSLLDIEGSIEKEMQARVLTGKDMNFDIARSLKLRGKETEALEEIYKQAGGYSELMSMAPYQLEATAEAAGMTVDQLIKGAEQQALFAQLSKDTGREIKNAADLREEDIAKISEVNQAEAKRLVMQQQQVAAQEKLSQLGTKITAIFGKIAEPLMEIIDPLMELVDFILPAIGPLLKFAFAPVQLVLDAIKGIVKIFNGDFLGGLSQIGGGIIKYLLRPFTLVFDLVKGFFPSLANWITGDKTKEAANTPVKKQNDAMIGSDGGLVVSGARGTYQLAADDTVIAGTNLGASTTTSSATTATSAGTGTDLTELVGLMRELVASVKQPAVIKIGNKVVNEIDRVQSMNRSYVGKVDNSYGAV